MIDTDTSYSLCETIKEAYNTKMPLHILGDGSKSFYGNNIIANELRVQTHTGITEYEPSELVLTARSGTLVSEIEAALEANHQYMPFEPPRFSDNSTIGGCIAAGLSGPARPFTGSVRDYVLGVKIINGKGEVLKFGGQVMKNVAGYDLSRLMTGALGTLGVLLEISIKVLPRTEVETCLCLELDETAANSHLQQWILQGQPITASCHLEERLYIRLSSTIGCVEQARSKIGGDTSDMALWHQLRDQRHDFFTGEQPLWRVSVPPATPELELRGERLTEWAGALRWYKSDLPADEIRDIATTNKGHATLFRNQNRLPDVSVFHPLSPAMLKLHQRLKKSLDPENILNPGRMYKGL